MRVRCTPVSARKADAVASLNDGGMVSRSSNSSPLAIAAFASTPSQQGIRSRLISRPTSEAADRCCASAVSPSEMSIIAVAPLRQPAPSSDPRFRASIAIPQLLRHALALPETLERERCTAEISGDPQGIALARAAPPHRPLGGPEHTHVDAVALGARQIATENVRAEIVRYPRDAA